MPETPPLHLNLFVMGVGHHEAAWRHPRTEPWRITALEHYRQLARTAEDAGFDSLFLADGLEARASLEHDHTGPFEPLTLLSALAVHTSRIGLIGTASTSYSEPFNLARQFASLDHLSGGRAGWNIVTSAGDGAARNFGRDAAADHAVRYERAEEFVDVATRLWASWEEGSLVVDPATGRFADPERVHRLDHRGTYFGVRGPLNAPRGPQGRPLLVQAGSSRDGREFAARWAEAVFTAQQTLDAALEFAHDLRTRTAAAGRDPQGVKVLPGIVPVIGATRAEAEALDRELDELITPERAVATLSGTLGVDLGAHPLDAPLPPLPDVADVNGAKSRFALIRDLAARERLTLRGLIGRLGGGRGHRVQVGTPEQIADFIEEWGTAGAADGFNVMPPLLPHGLDLFVEEVLPLLRRRGLFRAEYTAHTLRGHYGLDAVRDPDPTRTTPTATPQPLLADAAGASA